MNKLLSACTSSCGLKLLIVAAVALLCCKAAASQAKHNGQEVRESARRAVEYVAHAEADWIASQKCVSCHHTAFAVWSLKAAKERKIPIDEGKLQEWTGWVADWGNLMAPSVRAEAVRGTTTSNQCDTVAQILLAGSAGNAKAKQPVWFVQYVSDLRDAQEKDGSWRSGGQLPSQKRSKRETQEVSTMWSLLALEASHEKTTGAALERARLWLGEQTTGQSTEWWATRYLLERRLGSRAKSKYLGDELLKRQHEDGGWGWLCADESDALGTGMALFALNENASRNAGAISRARRFLLRTQNADGSWPVRGTKENKKNSIQPTATFWGTCWAVIGLCATIER
ncbi:MAG: hypothetical protein C5B50_21820 [Verrucomicrobia bacterium]|nr:MAG: hypothetical protein C5B50_21820 [Verrucomicrobiota bacterium]